MMDPDLDFLDLDKELEVNLPDDGKQYLRDLGLEEYNFESFLTGGGPGKFYENVPLEENPEAYLDVLTRESIRHKSDKKGLRAGKATAGGDTVGIYDEVGSRSTRSSDCAHSSKQNVPRKNTKTKVQTSTKNVPKRVSFSDTINGEIEVCPGKEQTPTVSPPQKEDPAEEGSKSHRKEPRPSAAIKPSQGRQGKDRENNIATRSPKKSKKFRFPGFSWGKKSDKSHDIILAYDGEGNINDPQHITDISEFSSLESSSSETQLQSTPPTTSEDFKSQLPSDLQDFTSQESQGGIFDLIDSCRESPTHVAHAQKHQTVKGRKIEKSAGSTEDQLVPDGKGQDSTERQREEDFAKLKDLVLGDVMKEGRKVDVVEIVSTQTFPSSSRGPPGDFLPPPLLASKRGQVALLDELVGGMSVQEAGSIRDGHGNTMMHLCAAEGHTECLDLLYRYFPTLLADENKTKLSPPALAIKNGQIDCLDWLLENTNLLSELLHLQSQHRRSLIHHAAKCGQDGCLRLLLSKVTTSESPPVLQDQHGNSPAHLAAKYGHLTCLQSLVEYGVDVRSINLYGHSPCYYADFSNHRQCAGYLMVVDTCHHIASDLHHITHKHLLLNEEHESIKGNLKESIGLTTTILRQWQQSMEFGAQSQQMADESSDLLREMVTQLQDLHMENSALRKRFNGANQSNCVFRDDVSDSITRASALVGEIEAMGKLPDQQTTRQFWVKVKELERRLMGLQQPRKQSEVKPTSDINLMMRRRLSQAVQKLVSYRTTMTGPGQGSAGGPFPDNGLSGPIHRNNSHTGIVSSTPKDHRHFGKSKPENTSSDDGKSLAPSSEVTVRRRHSMDNRLYEGREREQNNSNSFNVITVSVPNNSSSTPLLSPVDTSSSPPDSSRKSARLLGEGGHRPRMPDSGGQGLVLRNLGSQDRNDEQAARLERVRQHVLASSSQMSARSEVLEIVQPGSDISTDHSTDLEDMDNIESVSQAGDHVPFRTDDDIINAMNNLSLPVKRHNQQDVNTDVLGSNEDSVNIPVKLELTYADFKECYILPRRSSSEDIVPDVDPGTTVHNEIRYISSRDQMEEVHKVIADIQKHSSEDGTMEDTSSDQTMEADLEEADLEEADLEETDPDSADISLDLEDGVDPEDILVDPNLRLLPSLQFDMNLSTIEEMSVVSNSTREEEEVIRHNMVNSVPRNQHNTKQQSQQSGDDKHPKQTPAKGPLRLMHQNEDKPWYETSDDEDNVYPWQRRNKSKLPKQEHFTLF